MRRADSCRSGRLLAVRYVRPLLQIADSVESQGTNNINTISAPFLQRLKCDPSRHQVLVLVLSYQPTIQEF